MVSISSVQALHRIPGRIRLHVSSLYKDSSKSAVIQGTLLSQKGIHSVKPNTITGSLIILYDVNSISEEKLMDLMGSLADNTSQASSFNPQWLNTQSLYTPWSIQDSAEVCRALSSDSQNGLTLAQVKNLQEQFGPNIIHSSKPKSIIKLFMGQFDDFLVQLLMGASLISFSLGEIVDAVSIIIIIIIEACLGVAQEYKAEQSLHALKQLTTPQVKVIREGTPSLLPAQELVPGDIVLLQPGSLVPADGRVLESNYLEVIEASLTGESHPVCKAHTALPSAVSNPGDMGNMLFLGTNVVRGNGKMIVTSIGMDSEMGRIAAMLNQAEISSTPLQEQLDKLGMFITGVCITSCILITGIGIAAGRPFFEMLRLGVALAVGAIPESLSTIVTISMAVGIQRMVKQNAIVRKLPAIETLARTTVICSDKTGTLTCNEMTVREVYACGCTWQVTGDGYNPRGDFISEDTLPLPQQDEALRMLLISGCLCSNAALHRQGSSWSVEGDPTEAALLISAQKYSIPCGNLQLEWTRLQEIPFESDRMRMTTLCKNSRGEVMAFMKGAPDQLLQRCSQWLGPEGPAPLDEVTTRYLLKQSEQMADKALRVIALAYRALSSQETNLSEEELEQDFIFCGFSGMTDPPRPMVRDAIEKCHSSGVKVVMVTGDHPSTAAAVARELDILKEGKAITGSMLEEMSDDSLMDMIDEVNVFTRIAPRQKLRIVKAYKEKGYIVAMTGDGVNDAPAVKEAHIGIAMGRNGTDVTREASAITLADDNFTTIITAMEEGKAINQNIKKFMRYVLAGNLGEVLVIFLTAATTLPMPLVPSQILFINLATEGIPALALGIDPPSQEIMRSHQKAPAGEVLDGEVKKAILTRGLCTGLSTFGIFTGSYLSTRSLLRSQTLAFSNLVVSQLFHAFDCRHGEQKSDASNPYLIPSVMVSGLMLLGALYIPGLQGVFHTTALRLSDWILLLISSGIGSRLDSLFKPAGLLPSPTLERREIPPPGEMKP